MKDYHTLRQYESDFDKAQAEIRRAGALWIVASLSALAYLVLPGLLTIGEVERAVAVVGLGLIGNAGFFALWWVDQNTYQRLLHAIFVYGLYLEWTARADPDVLKPRSALFAQNLNVTGKLSTFYVMPMIVMTLAALAAAAIVQTWDDAAVATITATLEPPWIRAAVWGLFAIALSLLAAVARGAYMRAGLIEEYGAKFGPAFMDFAKGEVHRAGQAESLTKKRQAVRNFADLVAGTWQDAPDSGTTPPAAPAADPPA